MAQSKKSTYKRYSTDYNNMSNLSDAELRKYISSEADKLNKAFKRIRQEHMQEASPSYKYHEAKAFDHQNGLYYRLDDGSFGISRATVGISRQELIRRATEIKRARRAKTSTVRGINTAYRRATKTFNKKYADILPEPLTQAEIGELFRAAHNSGFIEAISSDEVVRLASKANVTRAEIVDYLNKHKFTKEKSTLKNIITNIKRQKTRAKNKHKNK